MPERREPKKEGPKKKIQMREKSEDVLMDPETLTSYHPRLWTSSYKWNGGPSFWFQQTPETRQNIRDEITKLLGPDSPGRFGDIALPNETKRRKAKK